MGGKHNLLQNIYLFKRMTGEELEIIAESASVETFGATDEIFAQSDRAQALYVIKYGSVRIHQRSSSGDIIEVATLGTGSHFGEMGFVDGEPRSAAATALEKSDIIVFTYDKLRDTLDRHPTIAVKFYQELAHFLCGRLRITTNDLSFAREKNLSHF
jgi:CRP/FNR family transcriptional regulator, cyclic AMP receptor protein